MGLIREPNGIDFIIQSQPLTLEEEALLSEFIRNRKIELKTREPRRKKAVVAKQKSLPA